jgi:nitroreductase
MDPVLARRSIRRYTDEDVSEEDVRYLLEAAMAAPSAGNEQPWHFIVIRERAVLDEIARVHPHAKMLAHAPLAFAVLGDPSVEKHEGYWVQDCSAATQNILIAATSRGIGTVWIGVYPREDRIAEMRRWLDVPEGIVPFAFIGVGHPSEEKPPSERFDEERVHRERWQG